LLPIETKDYKCQHSIQELGLPKSPSMDQPPTLSPKKFYFLLYAKREHKVKSGFVLLTINENTNEAQKSLRSTS